MKHFGISTLMAGCLMWALLDAAPIPSGNSCKDKKDNYYRPVRPINNFGIQAPQNFPNVVTGDVKDKDDTWVELTGNFVYDGTYNSKDVAEYGIAYREKGSNKGFKEIASTNLSDKTFSVKITNLDPNKIYEYHAYVKGAGEVYNGMLLTGGNKTFIIDNSIFNDR